MRKKPNEKWKCNEKWARVNKIEKERENRKVKINRKQQECNQKMRDKDSKAKSERTLLQRLSAEKNDERSQIRKKGLEMVAIKNMQITSITDKIVKRKKLLRSEIRKGGGLR